MELLQESRTYVVPLNSVTRRVFLSTSSRESKEKSQSPDAALIQASVVSSNAGKNPDTEAAKQGTVTELRNGMRRWLCSQRRKMLIAGAVVVYVVIVVVVGAVAGVPKSSPTIGEMFNATLPPFHARPLSKHELAPVSRVRMGDAVGSSPRARGAER